MKLTINADLRLLLVPDAAPALSFLPVIHYRLSEDADFLRAEPRACEHIAENGLRCTYDGMVLEMCVAQEDAHTCTVSGSLRNHSDVPVQLARVSWMETELHGRPEFRSSELMHNHSRIVRPDDAYVSTIQHLEKDTWGQWGVNWHRFRDPIHVQENFPRSTDVASVLWSDESQLTFGFIGPGTAFGEIAYGTCRENPLLLCSVMLDGVWLEPGTARVLETLMIHEGAEEDGMRRWVELCAAGLPPFSEKYAPVGYCSWYQYTCAITYPQYKNAIDGFAGWPATNAFKVIQLDDGFQNYPGDWRPNERFFDRFDSLAPDIEAAGGKAGLWLAPTTIFPEHPFVRNRPELVQRLPGGEPAVTFSNWEWCRDFYEPDNRFWGKTCYLEVDHPDCRAFMADIIRSAVSKGFKYLKLDFTYGISTARVPYDRHKTRFESLRDLYALFREAAGDDVYICACIGENGRYAMPYVNSARIGGDIGASYGHMTQNLPDFLLRIYTNGIWWNCDPDVYFMRSENSSLSLEESWILTGTIAALGCVFLTSDSADQWSEEAKRRVRLFWNETGVRIPEAVAIIRSGSDLPDALVCRHSDCRFIAVYNFSDAPRTISIDLSRNLPPCPAKHLVSIEGDVQAILADTVLTVPELPAHSLRIFRLAPQS